MNINFNDLHDKLAQKVNGLITKDDLYEWLNENIKISSYLPLIKKYALIRVFSDKFKDSMQDNIENEDDDFIYLMYDINQLFTLLFAYTDMILLSKYKTLDNYDLIMKSGFFDYMMQFCETDYRELISKCDRLTGIDNLYIMKQFIQSIGNQPSVEDVEKIRDIINNEVDKEKLEIIKAVQEYNNPMLKKIIGNISKENIEDVMKKSD